MNSVSRLLLVAAAGLLVAAEPPPAQIRLNQIGLLPEGPKRAILPSPEKRPLPWRLTDADGKVVASGRTQSFGADPWSGEHVHRIDFTSVRRAGSGYRLRAGEAESRPFAISATAFDRLPEAALNYFYQNRAGTPIEARFAGGPQWARPAGHLNERATCVSGKDEKGNVWPGCPYTLDVAGGWYDAGDHGKYVVNGGISVWTLLNLYERGLSRGAPAPFADGSAAMPEAGNGLNDLLDEARWQLEFLLKMQVPQGTWLRVPVGAKIGAPGLAFTEIDASGMAHHKVADEKWTPLPTAPHLDREKRQLFPPSTGATLNLAAVAAQCARIWRGIDAALSARCLAAAERAWTAARRNPHVYPIADFTGSGGYGDSDFADEFYWAAAELFLTTRAAGYQEALKASPLYRADRASEPGWNSVAALGSVSLALAPDFSSEDRRRHRGAIVAAAEAYLADSGKTGYAVPYAPAAGYPWGSTGAILNRAILLALAHDFTGEARFRDGVIDALDFILGRNPLDRSFVSGFGARPMVNPHHRFWARQFDPAFPPPPPGALSGGPNNIAMAEEVARALKGKCAPQTCWADDARAFSLNEVAINWNAPLVWVSSWAAELSGPRPAPLLAITVDDLPVHGELPRGETVLGIAQQVIAAFKAAKVPAVYGFVNGSWTERQPETEKVLHAWSKAGFPLGNHTWTHRDVNSASLAEFEEEIARNEPLLKRLGRGLDWRWFRYPFLAEGEKPEMRAAVRAILHRRGYRVADVTMDFSDWQWAAPYARCKATGDEAAVAAMERAYLDAARENIGFYRGLSRSLYGRDIPYVLLMHIGAFDARMLPRLLVLYREEGFRFVRLEEAQRDNFYRTATQLSLPAAPQGLEGRAAARGLKLPPRTSHAAMLDSLCRK